MVSAINFDNVKCIGGLDKLSMDQLIYNAVYGEGLSYKEIMEIAEYIRYRINHENS